MRNLKELENNIKQFIHRYAKEEKRDHTNLFHINTNKVYKITALIWNNIEKCIFGDDVYMDILHIILSEGEITLDILVDDINEYLSKYNFKIFKKLAYDKKDVINFMKHRLNNYTLLTAPIDFMFCWASTKSGHDKYSEINVKVNSKLIFFNRQNIESYIRKSTLKYT